MNPNRFLLVTFVTIVMINISNATPQQGEVIFDVDALPKNPKIVNKPQKVMFMGCGTDTVQAFDWDKDDQQYALPYQINNPRCPSGECVASSYYMASPPLFVEKQAILGQLTPDRFNWDAPNLQQKVVMDYSVLQPVSLGEIQASFIHAKNAKNQTCLDQNVSLVPINIACKGLPKIHGTMSTSGIGFLKSDAGKSQIFVPLVGPEHNTAVECTASILNDIVLGHEIYFDDQGTQRTSISMTTLYNDNRKMNFVCQSRPPGEVPAGCLPLEK